MVFTQRLVGSAAGGDQGHGGGVEKSETEGRLNVDGVNGTAATAAAILRRSVGVDEARDARPERRELADVLAYQRDAGVWVRLRGLERCWTDARHWTTLCRSAVQCAICARGRRWCRDARVRARWEQRLGRDDGVRGLSSGGRRCDDDRNGRASAVAGWEPQLGEVLCGGGGCCSARPCGRALDAAAATLTNEHSIGRWH
ncbi:uncharacterized protein V1518DRAFT_415541 [Limtongia smithiae]|uniref:uncharacterized protein n=1 Tax=Limtongia smithiae TaxID=1125753 RepID=UPI0034D0204E